MRCPSQTVVRALFQAPQRYGLHPCSHSTLFSSFLGGTLVPCPTVVKRFCFSQSSQLSFVLQARPWWVLRGWRFCFWGCCCLPKARCGGLPIACGLNCPL